MKSMRTIVNFAGYSSTIVLLSCFFLLFMNPKSVKGLQTIRIGTGGSTGVYYPIGKLIATGLTTEAAEKDSALNGYIGVAQNSAGSIENTHGVINGEIEVGLVQADIAAFAHKGTRVFKDISGTSSVRAIASLYAEKFQIVVRNDANIDSFDDLNGKRVSLDELGSGTLSVMRIILDAQDMNEDDLMPQYLKPAFTYEKMVSGELQGFVMMAGAPMEAVSKLLKTGVSLVPIEPVVAGRINKKFSYLYPGKVDANIYPGIPETPTLEVYALLIVSEKMSDEIAYAITKALFSVTTSRLLREGHPQGSAITLDTALNGISIPLHPAAKRFYREIGVLR